MPTFRSAFRMCKGVKGNKGYGGECVSDVDFFIKLIFFFYNICLL